MTWTCPESMRMPRLGSLSLVPPHTTQHQDSSVFGFGTLSPPLPPRVAKRATDARNLSRFVREDDGRFQGMRQPTEIPFHQGARVRHQLGQRQRFDGPMVPAVRLGQGGGEVSQSAQGHLHTKRDIYTQKRKLSHNNRGRWQPANGDRARRRNRWRGNGLIPTQATDTRVVSECVFWSDTRRGWQG